MSRFRLIFALASLASICASLSLRRRYFEILTEDTPDSNKFVDDLLESILPRLKEEFEPATLPEAGFEIQKKVLLVTVHGEVKIYDGWLAGISTLLRTGDAHVIKTTGSTTHGCMVHLDAHMGIANLVGHYKAYAKFMNLGPSFEVTLSLPSISFAISLKQDVNQEGSRPTLAFFDVEHIGHVEIKLNGVLGPLNWIVGKVSSFVGNIVKGFIANVFQSPIRNLLSEKLQTSDISLDRFGCDKLKEERGV